MIENRCANIGKIDAMDNKKRVAVLIATYNGEKYIQEQLESVIDQSYHNIEIYLRDDGSTDATLQVLEKYEKSDRIHIIRGQNVGYGPGFLELLSISEDADYWAFCDQDDVWDRDKITNAVAYLEEQSPEKPCMYFHNFYLTDEDLKVTGTYCNRIPDYSFSMAITECLHLGFATVINRPLRALALRGNIHNIISHDWWMELVAMEFADIYTDDYIGAYHRRLGESVSGMGLQNRVRWFCKALKGNAEIDNLTKIFYQTFAEEMNVEDCRILKCFAETKPRIRNSLRKAFYPKRWRSSLVSEFVVRSLMLIGKI